MKIWAVIPSGNRRDQLQALVRRLRDDNVDVVVIDTGYVPPLRESELACVIVRDEGPKNISRWWNTGLDVVESLACDFAPGDAVAVLNDDVIVDGSQLRHLAWRMFQERATVAYPNMHGVDRDITLTEPVPVDLRLRLQGYCFVLDPWAGLRADERLVWWYGDDDIDWRARERGGSLMVHDVVVQHTHPNGWQATNPELLAQTIDDRMTFLTKWGRTPW